MTRLPRDYQVWTAFAQTEIAATLNPIQQLFPSLRTLLAGNLADVDPRAATHKKTPRKAEGEPSCSSWFWNSLSLWNLKIAVQPNFQRCAFVEHQVVTRLECGVGAIRRAGARSRGCAVLAALVSSGGSSFAGSYHYGF